MDLQTAINGLLTCGSAVIGWFAVELWSHIKMQRAEISSLRSDLYDLREEIANNRVHREDFKEALREVKDMLHRIIEKLEKKVDK